MRTIALPRPIAARVVLREVEVGDVVFNVFDESDDAPPVEVTFTASINEEAEAPGSRIRADILISGSVMISRAEIAAAAGAPYETLNQKKISRAGLQVAIDKLSPAAAAMVAKIESTGAIP